MGTQLQGFVDVNYAGNIDARKSLTRYVFIVFGGAMSWMANLQSVVDLSPVAVMPFDFGLDECYQQNL